MGRGMGLDREERGGRRDCKERIGDGKGHRIIKEELGQREYKNHQKTP